MGRSGRGRQRTAAVPAVESDRWGYIGGASGVEGNGDIGAVPGWRGNAESDGVVWQTAGVSVEGSRESDIGETGWGMAGVEDTQWWRAKLGGCVGGL